jgi:DNA polymerase-3 subunit alpha
LGITDVDPLEYSLLFERFLNPERITMPDIDIDFCARRRSEVIEYVKSKYGKDNVAQIITFQTMQAKAAVKDVGRALNFKYSERDKITKLIPNTPGVSLADCINTIPQLNEMIKNPDIENLISIAMKLEGIIRNASTHAAGIVIAPVPLIELVPLARMKEGEIVTQYDMNALEQIGLLKMDFLGLSNLTIIEDTIRLIKRNKGIEVNLNEIPVDDENVFKLFSNGKTDGVFQFESAGMKQQLMKVKPTRFEDLIALNALYRPGPMQMIDDYCARKNGEVPVEYEIPEMEEILKETYGIMVYQEQVMQIASKVAGYSLGEADVLRRAMGKKKRDIMEAQKDKFITRAEEKGIPKDLATKIFNKMSSFAEYGFNKSHSAAYAYLAYQIAYLKVYYPVEFMAALLSNKIGDLEEVSKYLKECKEMGIEVLPPDVNESEEDFSIKGNKIRIGLAAVKNVGSAALSSIIKARKRYGRFASLFDFCEKVDLTKVNKRVIESLIKSGAFDSFGMKRKFLFDSLATAMDYGMTKRKDKEFGQALLFEPQPDNTQTAYFNDKKINSSAQDEEWLESDLLAYEKDTLGFYLSGHPLEKYIPEIKEFTTCSIEEITDKHDGKEVLIAGIINHKNTKRLKDGKCLTIFELEDMTDRIEAIVFPSSQKALDNKINNNAEVIIKGKIDISDNRKQLIVSDVIPLSKAAEYFGKAVIIKIHALGISEEKLKRLQKAVKNHPGQCTLYLDFLMPDKSVIRIKTGENYKVKASNELKEEINSILGQASTTIIGE